MVAESPVPENSSNWRTPDREATTGADHKP